MSSAPLQSPIMVIGAGRSGSTLISRMLDAHSAIDFKGETSFLLLRLWVEVWHDRFWLNWPRHVAARPHSAAAPVPHMPPNELATERARVGELVAEMIVRLLRVQRKDRRFWGYKELWSGLSQYNHDWSAYDAVLPGAHWLHLVRDPFDFARSCAAWNGTLLTRDYLEARLSNWVDMVECNRRRIETGRYHEVRMEDLARKPEETLGPILSELGLGWESAMTTALGKKTMASDQHTDDETASLSSNEINILIDQIPELAEAMNSYCYTAPPRVLLSAQTRAESSVDLRDPENEQKGAFLPRHVLEAQLHTARSTLSELTGMASQDGFGPHKSLKVEPAEAFQRVRSVLVKLTEALKQ